MCPSDPVTFLPPHADELPPGLTQEIRDIIIGGHYWDQGGQGIVIDPNGGTIFRKYPPNAPVKGENTFGEYIGDLVDAIKVSHSFINYINAMQARLPRIAMAAPGLVRQGAMPLVNGNLCIALVPAILGGLGKMAYVDLPKANTPSIVRVAANQYSIFWMGYNIMGPCPQGSARATLNKIKSFLRRFPPSGTLHTVSFQNAIQAFCTAIQTGGPGWNPDPWPFDLS
jgi:hypothetical protein